MKYFLILIVFALLLFLPFQISASPTFGFGTLFFGLEEKIVEIQNLPETDYTLCHKYTYHSYLAGIYLTDDGYVIQKRGNPFNYLPLDQMKIAELQESGELPNPLPKYSIPISAYIFGYSLWWSILVLFGIIIFNFYKSRKRN